MNFLTVFKTFFGLNPDAFTFYGGGGKGGGGGGSSTTTTTLDPTVRPFVQYGLEEAKGLYQQAGPEYYPYQTYVSPSQQTQAALQAAQQRALQGSPLIPAAQQQLQSTIQGQYLGNNPFLAQAMSGAASAATQAYQDAIQGTRSGASQAGRYGSGAMFEQQGRAQQNLANALAQEAGRLMYQNYGAERQAQQQAIQQAPTLAQADYGDIQQLQAIGQTMEDYQRQALESDIARFEYGQNLPYTKLQSFLSAAYGAPTGAVSQTSQSGGKIVCTMMNESYGFGSYRNAIWLKHSENMPNAKVYEKGYHKLFLPMVKFAKGKGKLNRIVKKALEHIARHRTADIYKEMRGKKRDKLGRIYRAILEPICYLAGRI